LSINLGSPLLVAGNEQRVLFNVGASLLVATERYYYVTICVRVRLVSSADVVIINVMQSS
jgi:hypothetical protein